MSSITRNTLGLALVAALLAFGLGCGSDGKQPPSDPTKDPKAAKDKNGGTKHEGWWCDEHGIPEDECSMCSTKVANAFKAKGDWCEKHDRAMSQCFFCKPERREFYAAMYRAKNNGKDPPPIEEFDSKKDGKDKK
jgi:hypothetical protein